MRLDPPGQKHWHGASPTHGNDAHCPRRSSPAKTSSGWNRSQMSTTAVALWKLLPLISALASVATAGHTPTCPRGKR